MMYASGMMALLGLAVLAVTGIVVRYVTLWAEIRAFTLVALGGRSGLALERLLPARPSTRHTARCPVSSSASASASVAWRRCTGTCFPTRRRRVLSISWLA